MAQTHIKAKKDQPLSASADARRDLVPRTGMGGGQVFIEAASKFLASNGKILAPLIVVLLVGIFVYYGIRSNTDSGIKAIKSKIDTAALAAKQDRLREDFEQVIESVRGKPELESYARFRYAMRSYDLLTPPYKPEELKVAIGVMQEYLDAFAKNDQFKAQNDAVQAAHDRVAADVAFLEKHSDRLPFTAETKFDKPETKKVKAPENPVVVFVTSAGTLRFELYEDEAGNGVKNLVSLCDEGFYNRTSFSAQEFSNKFSSASDFQDSTVITAGSLGRPKGVKLEKPAGKEKDDSVDTTPVKLPYEIEYSGDARQVFAPGSIAYTRDVEQESRTGSEFFVVIEPSAMLKQHFAPLGKIKADSPAAFDEAMKIASRLDKAQIYYTYVEQQRDGVDYKPRVYYTGWPTDTVKRDDPPKPLRFNGLTQIIDDKANPIVVIELEAGDVVIELYGDEAPNTVANFVSLVEEGFYDKDASFYRVDGAAKGIVEIMREANTPHRLLQGGRSQTYQHDYVIKNEAMGDKYKLKNSRGTISMARTNDLDSASTEFFINLKDHKDYDKKSSPYCAFGEVVQGMDLLESVKANDAIKSIKVIRKQSAAYVAPTVKYKSTMDWVPKKKVDAPAAEPPK